jgi:hypothetical protein
MHSAKSASGPYHDVPWVCNHAALRWLVYRVNAKLCGNKLNKVVFLTAKRVVRHPYAPHVNTIIFVTRSSVKRVLCGRLAYARPYTQLLSTTYWRRSCLRTWVWIDTRHVLEESKRLSVHMSSVAHQIITLIVSHPCSLVRLVITIIQYSHASIRMRLALIHPTPFAIFLFLCFFLLALVACSVPSSPSFASATWPLSKNITFNCILVSREREREERAY